MTVEIKQADTQIILHGCERGGVRSLEFPKALTPTLLKNPLPPSLLLDEAVAVIFPYRLNRSYCSVLFTGRRGRNIFSLLFWSV